ncbi:dUTP diphosphatase [Longimonas sp.]|uniref:dUTP diphosphatase n=1 Tax=Longimonas sp. TaxID=2039626 RepID=UPI003365A9E3
MQTRTVHLVQMPHAEGLPLPEHATEQSAGADLRAAIPNDSPITLASGERTLVPTGLQIALPPDCEGQVRPRSGLAVRHGVTVINAPGTIDADYRGEVKVALVNIGQEPFTVERGMRIAQLVVARYERIDWTPAETLDATERGEGGFGSTGTT